VIQYVTYAPDARSIWTRQVTSAPPGPGIVGTISQTTKRYSGQLYVNQLAAEFAGRISVHWTPLYGYVSAGQSGTMHR